MSNPDNSPKPRRFVAVSAAMFAILAGAVALFALQNCTKTPDPVSPGGPSTISPPATTTPTTPPTPTGVVPHPEVPVT